MWKLLFFLACFWDPTILCLNSIEVQSVDVVQVKNIAKKAKNTYRCSKTPLHKNFKLSLQQNVINHSYPEKSCRSQKCLVWSQNQWFLFSRVIFVSNFFSISKIFIYGGCRQEGNEEAEDKFGKTDSIWTENPDINTNSFTKCKRPVQHDFLCEQTAFWPSYCPCRFWTLRPTWIMMMRSMTFSYFGIKKK